MLHISSLRHLSAFLPSLTVGLILCSQSPILKADWPGKGVFRLGSDSRPSQESYEPPRGPVAPDAGADAEAMPATENMVKERQPGTSSKAVRTAATATLPIDKLNPKNQQRANEILRTVSLFRRMPTVAFEVDPQVYMFFASHPDVAVSIWRALDISTFQMWQTAKDEYEADAGDGSVGIVDVMYRSADEGLLYCEGSYKSPFLSKPIEAKALMHLQTSFFRESDGVVYATHRVDLFVSFPSQTVETLAKVVSPLGNVIADRNFHEISVFLHLMSIAMSRQPAWVEQLTKKMDGVLEGRKTELMKVTSQAHRTAVDRELAKNPPAADPRLPRVLASPDPAGPGERPIRSVYLDRTSTQPVDGIPPSAIGVPADAGMR